MAGKHDTFENDVLKLFLNATPIANLADNAASAPNANLYMSLHVADPGEAGNQTTNEIAYTSYARATIPRTSAGFTVSANVASLTTDVVFPLGTGGAGTATFFGIGTAASGTGKLLWSGALTPGIVCGNGVTPVVTTATQIFED